MTVKKTGGYLLYVISNMYPMAINHKTQFQSHADPGSFAEAITLLWFRLRKLLQPWLVLLL